MVCHDYNEKSFNVDILHDFSMYFKELNPQSFQQKKIKQTQWTKVFKAMASSNGITDNFSSKEFMHLS